MKVRGVGQALFEGANPSEFVRMTILHEGFDEEYAKLVEAVHISQNKNNPKCLNRT